MNSKERYQSDPKFRERCKERAREYRRNNKDKKRQQDKEYKRKNYQKIKIKQSERYQIRKKLGLTKQYRDKNKIKIREWKRQSYRRNFIPKRKPSKFKTKKERDHAYYLSHKEQARISNKIRYEKNKPKILHKAKLYRRKYPEKRLKLDQKYYAETGYHLDMTAKECKFALLAWSKAVRKGDNNECQICFQPAVHAHHILHKKFYPKLALNLNNGISLCKKHHDEAHGINLGVKNG